MADSRLMHIFSMEARKCLAQMEAAWESLCIGIQDGACRAELWRGAHTIKGNAAMMGFSDLSTLAAATEQCANQFQKRDDKIEDPILQTLRESLDALTIAVGAIDDGLGDVGTADSGLLTRLASHTPSEQVSAA